MDQNWKDWCVLTTHTQYNVSNYMYLIFDTLCLSYIWNFRILINLLAGLSVEDSQLCTTDKEDTEGKKKVLKHICSIHCFILFTDFPIFTGQGFMILCSHRGAEWNVNSWLSKMWYPERYDFQYLNPKATYSLCIYPYLFPCRFQPLQRYRYISANKST